MFQVNSVVHHNMGSLFSAMKFMVVRIYSLARETPSRERARDYTEIKRPDDRLRQHERRAYEDFDIADAPSINERARRNINKNLVRVTPPSQDDCADDEVDIQEQRNLNNFYY